MTRSDSSLPASALAPGTASGTARDPAMWWRRARRSAAAGALLAVLSLALLVGYAWWLAPQAPNAQQVLLAGTARASVLLSSDGKTLATFSRAQTAPIPLADVPPHLVQALIATEDRRFHEHRGVDWRRTVAAVGHTLTGKTQGGSTLTQQLARNLFPEEIGRSRSVERKLKEIVTALRIERHFDKQQILQSYLNNAPFLHNVVGIEMAARTYFDKPARELSLVESATLVGMLKGTAYYNPVSRPARAKARRDLVLRQMVRFSTLSDADYRSAIAQPLQLQLNLPTEGDGVAPHFVNQARQWLTTWAEEHNLDLRVDGLVVHSTLDSRLQQAATEAVEQQAAALQAVADVEWSQAALAQFGASTAPYLKQQPRVQAFAHLWRSRPDLLAAFIQESPDFKKALAAGSSPAAALQKLLADSGWITRLKREKSRLEAGLVAMDPASGEVLAWVGSRDFNTDQFDHVAQARRQPGSTFKPFVYGAALERGFSPERSYINGAVEVGLPGGQTWHPSDMDAPDDLPMSLRDGLVHSKNTVTVQVSQEVGIQRVAALARAMGVDQSPLDVVPSLALGTSPVSLLEMVNAYSTIAAQGQHHKPLLIKRITDRHGKVLAEFQAPQQRAMSEDSAVELIDMMRGVVSQGTGTAVRTRFGIQADVAGKTGTTQNNTDGWFILMHPRLVAGAWVGFNDGRVTLRSNYWGQGGHNAILPVGAFFRDALGGGLIDRKSGFPPRRRAPPPEPVDDAAAPQAPASGAADAVPDNAMPAADGQPPQPPQAPQAPTRPDVGELERVINGSPLR